MKKPSAARHFMRLQAGVTVDEALAQCERYAVKGLPVLHAAPSVPVVGVVELDADPGEALGAAACGIAYGPGVVS